MELGRTVNPEAPDGISSQHEQITQELYVQLADTIRDLGLDEQSRNIVENRLSHMLVESVISRLSRT